VYRGLVQIAGGSAWLVSDTGRIEVLQGTSLPASIEDLAQARSQTIAQLQPSDGKVVALRGRRQGNIFLAREIVSYSRKAASAAQEAGDAFAEVNGVLDAHRSMLLGLPGVLTVRPGYLFTDGWITREPAIVVIVRPEPAATAATRAIPQRLDGIPVDVRPAGPAEQLLALTRQTALTTVSPKQLEQAHEKMALALPGWETVPGAALAESEEAASALARPVHYDPPPDLQLAPVKGPMNIICHCSPDAGWATLHTFIQGTAERLTCAMYDFTAPHILDAIKSAMSHVTGPLSLDMDGDTATGIGTGDPDHNAKARDIPKTQVRTSLARALGRRFIFTWAAVAHTDKSRGGIFKTAYHIKVAVRDGNAFWLSSGNWQSSNQPNLDPLGPDRNFPHLQTMFDRDWHVIVEGPELAALYEGFIKWDIKEAIPLMITSTATATEPAELDLLVPDSLGAALAQPTFFAPERMEFAADDPLEVQPLLTPDNYVKSITELVQSAKHTLYMQNQYIKVPRIASDSFTELLDALKERIEAGVDVRVILRGDFDTAPMLEALQNYGFDMSHFRLQKALHNKGVIVDGQAVAVGSHNWSDDGVLYNRDATLIFHHERVAQYYQKVFLYDWANLAKQQVPVETEMALVATANDPVPPGMVRVPWDVYYSD
jgi:hypothetical protein